MIAQSVNKKGINTKVDKVANKVQRSQVPKVGQGANTSSASLKKKKEKEKPNQRQKWKK